MQTKRFFVIFSIAVLILLIPLIGMQFSDQVNWTLSDFIIGGLILFGAGLSLDYAGRRLRKNQYRIPVLIFLFILLVLIWAELAVGIFGTPFSGS